MDSWEGRKPEPGDLMVSEPGGSWYLVDGMREVRHRTPRANPSLVLTVVRLGHGFDPQADNAGARVHEFHWHSRDGSRAECPYCD